MVNNRDNGRGNERGLNVMIVVVYSDGAFGDVLLGILSGGSCSSSNNSRNGGCSSVSSC